MIKLKIEGMTCEHCSAAVKRALAGVAGVTRVEEVSVERGEARVEGQADPQRLIAAVESEGYKARLA